MCGFAVLLILFCRYQNFMEEVEHVYQISVSVAGRWESVRLENWVKFCTTIMRFIMIKQSENDLVMMFTVSWCLLSCREFCAKICNVRPQIEWHASQWQFGQHHKHHEMEPFFPFHFILPQHSHTPKNHDVIKFLYYYSRTRTTMKYYVTHENEKNFPW